MHKGEDAAAIDSRFVLLYLAVIWPVFFYPFYAGQLARLSGHCFLSTIPTLMQCNVCLNHVVQKVQIAQCGLAVFLLQPLPQMYLYQADERYRVASHRQCQLDCFRNDVTAHSQVCLTDCRVQDVQPSPLVCSAQSDVHLQIGCRVEYFQPVARPVVYAVFRDDKSFLTLLKKKGQEAFSDLGLSIHFE